ncbi:hypothetical protein CNY89_25465, partial [Amaricoccus sp. HAR-UPW-R2A-40]
AYLDSLAQAYLAGRDPRDPLVSPLFADLAGLPPVLIQVGSAETLLDDPSGPGRFPPCAYWISPGACHERAKHG